MNNIKTLMADTDFQNRFGMHTQAFQELAANAILFTLSKLVEEHKRVSTPARPLDQTWATRNEQPEDRQQDVAIRAAADRLVEVTKERDDYKKRKDEAYTERNRVVVAFAKLAMVLGWSVAVTRTAIPGWSEDWHGCIFIDTPQGQVSWHFHDSQADLFKALPHRPATWDGHTTLAKYERLEALVACDPNPKFSTPAVQAALIAAQAEEIKRLIAERDEAARLSHQYRNERDAQADAVKQRDMVIRTATGQLAEVTKERNDAQAAVERFTIFKNLVHDRLDDMNIPKFDEHPCRVAQRLSEVAQTILRLRDENAHLAACLARDQTALRNAGFSLDGNTWLPPREDSLIRFQNIARHTDRALRAMTVGTTPDIDVIQDGCIKIHLKEVLAQFDKLKEFKKLVHKRLDEMNIPQFAGQECRISARLDEVAEALKDKAGYVIWKPEDPLGRLCLDACHEANRARGLFPHPNHLTLALAEEAGEITKAVLDHRQGKADLASVRKEIVQTMAMCLRLATEGDPTVDLTWSQS